MGTSVFSTYWYRVAHLKPQLRDSTAIYRHVYRGQRWYVLQNRLTGRIHRFNAAAYAFIGQMDGQKTVQQIWESVVKHSGDAVASQDETIGLLVALHDAELIQNEILPSVLDLYRQAVEAPSSRHWKQRLANPFSLRFALWDPDRFLDKWSFLAVPLFSRPALALWLLIVLSALLAATVHRTEIAASLADRLLSPGNLLLLWLIYPLVKTLHELGHALAVKRWGGEVHEMGIQLLALTPIPYVDATASAAFPEKRQRVAVVAMGAMVELLLASVALFVWLNVETGLISAAAYNVMLICGLSTVLFNGNPLVRYDGYYMLADLLEIPNLGARSSQYLSYLAERHLLGIDSARSPVTAKGEAGWFLLYGPLSLCYRVAMLTALVWLVSDRFFSLGVLIAVWGVVVLLIRPILRGWRRLLDAARARGRGSRLALVGGAVAALLLLLLAMPLPLWTTAQGVIWLPEQAAVRAGTPCEVLDVLIPPGRLVAKDEPLLKGSDPFLEAELEVGRARLDELYASYHALPIQDRASRQIALEDIERAKAELQQIEEQMGQLLVRSPAQGNFVLIDERNLPGRFVRQGELLGYIVSDRRPTIRTVVRQADIGLVRERVTGVEVRLAENPADSLKAEVVRVVPSAAEKLPTAALGTSGGGTIPVDPADPDGMRALESVFQLDLGLPAQVGEPHFGGRVYVRFEHGRMPLALQWYRSLRQLLLSKDYA